jgi:protein SCO1/2
VLARRKINLLFSYFLCFSVFVVLTGCGRAAGELPDYGKVPDFRMVDSQGHDFDSRSLNGKVWVADFIYTSCPGVCPRMTSEMARVSQRLAKENDVRLVSISVDPEHDSPPVLNAFAHRYGGPTPTWIFLTGTPQTIHLLAYKTFHMGDIIAKMDHSTKFALVDGQGHIRGYYDSFDPASIEKMMRDVEVLREASS